MRRVTGLTACVLLLVLYASGVEGQDQGKEEKVKDLTTAPKGFDAKRDGIGRGKMETVEYDSKTVGAKRKAQVYTPPRGHSFSSPPMPWRRYRTGYFFSVE